MRAASSGWRRSRSAMFVSGPIGAIAMGSGCSRRSLAMRATAPSGAADAEEASSFVFPIPLAPWTSVARTTAPKRGPAAPSATGMSLRP